METGKIKLVAADMDGTLLNRDRKITQYTQNVIKKAMAQGVYFVPATGRAVNALPPELKEMEGIRYGIFSNGATIYDLKEEKVIYKNHFEMDRVLELMDFLKQFDLMESISLNGQSYANKKEMENIDYYELDSNTKAIVQGSRVLVDDLEMFVKEQSTTVEKTTLLFKTMEERRRAADALSKIEDIQFSSSLPKNLEISKKGCNKGDGLFHLAKILNIQKEEIMSCGDADNDRELLESAGLAVVMENGPECFLHTLDGLQISLRCYFSAFSSPSSASSDLEFHNNAIAKAPKIITCVVGLSNSVNIQYSAKIAYAIKPISRFLKQYTYPNKMENKIAKYEFTSLSG